jgi:hypothetical protein
VRNRNSWTLLGLLVALSAPACQVQTQSIGLCESLQQQGADATCWLRDELIPARLVAPQVLFTDGHESLDVVLQQIAEEKTLTLAVGSRFENDVSRFVIQCAASSTGECVLELMSTPRRPAGDVLAPPLLEAVNWVAARSADFDLVLLDTKNVRRRFSVAVSNNEMSLRWSDSEAKLPHVK